MTNLLKSTAFVTIYQASENIYETFDKVTVLYSGKQIYFGLIHEAKPYFAKWVICVLQGKQQLNF